MLWWLTHIGKESGSDFSWNAIVNKFAHISLKLAYAKYWRNVEIYVEVKNCGVLTLAVEWY